MSFDYFIFALELFWGCGMLHRFIHYLLSNIFAIDRSWISFLEYFRFFNLVFLFLLLFSYFDTLGLHALLFKYQLYHIPVRLLRWLPSFLFIISYFFWFNLFTIPSQPAEVGHVFCSEVAVFHTNHVQVLNIAHANDYEDIAENLATH